MKRVVVFYAAMLGPLLGLLAWVYHTKHDTLLPDYWGGGILYVVIGGFAWVWRHELRGKFSWPRQASVKTWLVVAVTPLVTVAAAYLFLAMATRLGVPAPQESLLEKSWSAGFPYGWIAVLPALFEEIAFRGLLLAKLQRLMGPVQAAWVTAILFGVLHFNVFGLAVFLVPLALVAAWLTHRTQSLWPAILLHFLHNATVVTLTLLA